MSGNKNIMIGQMPLELVWSLGGVFLVLGLLLIYFWYKKKIRKDFYLELFNGNLKATSPNEANKKIPRHFNIDTKKTLAKHPVPTFRIRNSHLICLYSGIIFILFALTLLVGEPLGLI